LKKLTNKILFISLLNYFFVVITDVNCQWEQMSSGIGAGKSIQCMVLDGNSILAGTSDAGIFKSTNNGLSWNSINNGLTVLNVKKIYISGNIIYAGVYSGGVFRSTDNGNNWIQVNSGIENRTVEALISFGGYLFAGTSSGGGVFISTNNGNNWTPVNSGISYMSIYALESNGSFIFAAAANGVYRSSNFGTNWTQVVNGFSYYLGVNFFYKENFNIYAGKNDGLYSTSNNGDNWVNLGLTNQCVSAFIKYNNIFFAGLTSGTGTSGVVLSTNNGANWITKNQGFTVTYPFPPDVKSILISGNFIYAGTEGQSIWRRSLIDITDIKNINSSLPEKYSLLQNYPNPFNPSTNIRYQITNNKFVKITVYDLLGKEIETLVNEKQSPGTYEVTFDGSNYPSGVYFYKLSSGDFSETKKMVLIK